MRKYQPIWNAVKKDSTASIAAEPTMHARIIQAVRKEKSKDLGWKMECLDACKKYEMKEKVEGKMITFYLVDISPVSLNSL